MSYSQRIKESTNVKQCQLWTNMNIIRQHNSMFCHHEDVDHEKGEVSNHKVLGSQKKITIQNKSATSNAVCLAVLAAKSMDYNTATKPSNISPSVWSFHLQHIVQQLFEVHLDFFLQELHLHPTLKTTHWLHSQFQNLILLEENLVNRISQICIIFLNKLKARQYSGILQMFSSVLR